MQRFRHPSTLWCVPCASYLVIAILLLASARADADATIAVATNFIDTARKLADTFAADAHDKLTLVSGSSGALYAQIRNGAPYDVFLSADQERPAQLIEAKLAIGDTRRTYAFGRLLLWYPTAATVNIETLRRGEFRHLALANPELAPYGAAAREVLQRLGLWDALQSKIVLGENIGQAATMVASGNAELGIVAAAPPSATTRGARWEIPEDLHTAIRQDAVLLQRGKDNATARAFLLWLQGSAARAIIVRDGYRDE